MGEGIRPGAVARVEGVAGDLRRIAVGLDGLAGDPALRWRSRGAAAFRQRLRDEAVVARRLAARVDEAAGRLRRLAAGPSSGPSSHPWSEVLSEPWSRLWDGLR